MTRRLRTIIVGFGKVASRLASDARMARYYRRATHAQVLRAHPAFDWQAVVDPSPEARDHARCDWQVPHVGADLRSVAAKFEPEVAAITAPPNERCHILDLLPSVRAVLVEKPLGTRPEEAQEFLDVCRRRGVLVQVNYFRRADHTYRRLAAGLLRELIGLPQAVFGVYGRGLHNNAGHVVDLVRMLLGEVSSVQALSDAVAVPDAALPGDVNLPFAMTLRGGALVSIHPLDFREYREVGIDVWGTQGRLAFLQEGLGLHHFPLADNRALEGAKEIASDHMERLVVTLGDAYYAMYDNLAKAILNGADLYSSGESACATEAVIGAALRSAYDSRRPVAVSV